MVKLWKTVVDDGSDSVVGHVAQGVIYHNNVETLGQLTVVKKVFAVAIYLMLGAAQTDAPNSAEIMTFSHVVYHEDHATPNATNPSPDEVEVRGVYPFTHTVYFQPKGTIEIPRDHKLYYHIKKVTGANVVNWDVHLRYLLQVSD